MQGHPQGTTAGGIAFTDAIQAVVSGRSLKEAAEDSPALRSAHKKWGADNRGFFRKNCHFLRF
ncbi:hypothetical protein [Peribacillus simplex]|uniref:hypothetical protein n=1 Tax=Peribacillus simplex TaxID=1478 RepID=UPI001F50419E|nr:hypothetical protein [Peribacillus simplex]